MRKTLYIPIDTTLENVVECDKLIKRGDTLTLTIKVFTNGVLADLTNQFIDIILKKSDNSLIEKTIDSSDISNGVVTVTLEQQATLVVGLVSGELQIYTDGTLTATNTFTFEVGTSLADDVIEASQHDIDVLQDLKEVIADGENTINTYETHISAISNSIESIEALGNIKSYIDTNLADLESENAQAVVNIANETIQNDEAVQNIADLTSKNATANQNISDLDSKNLIADENITDLDTKNATASSNISSLDSKNGIAETNISNLDSKNATASSNIAALDSENDRAEINISALESFGDATTLLEDTTALKSEIETARGGKVDLSARLDGIDADLSDIAYVSHGNLAEFKAAIGSNRTIVLSGDFNINETINIQNISNLIIKGIDATLNISDSFQFVIQNCENVTFEDLNIIDTATIATAYEIFDFITCIRSGIKNIKYNATNPLKKFAYIRTGSKRCFVENCDINMVRVGIWIGDNGDNSSVYIEPSLNPTQYCIIKNNKINNFISHGIATRSRYNLYDLSTEDSKLRHIIKENLITNCNVDGSYTTSVYIETWSSENIVEKNIIIANSSQTSHLGISIANAYKNICTKNKVYGAFNYQGIEIATGNDNIIEDNYISGIGIGSSSTKTGAIGVASSVDGNPVSENNVIKGNIIQDCKVGVYLDLAANVKNSKILCNTISGCTTGIYSVGSIFNISNNTLKNNIIQIQSDGYGADDIPSVIINNDLLFDENINGMHIANINTAGTGRPLIIKNNKFSGWKERAILLRCKTSQIIGNTFKKDNRTTSGWVINWACIVKGVSYGVMSHIIKDNVIIDSDLNLSISGMVNDYAGLNNNGYDFENINNNGKKTLLPTSATPTSGTWQLGDKVYNYNPTPGSYEGWICTAAGTPGTWKGFGLIQT